MRIEQGHPYQPKDIHKLRLGETSLEEFSFFVRHVVPQINMRNYSLEASRGQNGEAKGELNANLQQLATRTNQFAQRITETRNLLELDLRDTLAVHLPLALSLASVARFASDQDTERTMDPTITVLQQIGETHALPPWLTANEYYLHNDPRDPLTFTGHPGERLFIDIARDATSHFDTTAEKLLSVTTAPRIQAENAADLQEASSLLGKGREEFRRFHTDSNWSNQFFYEVLRGFSRPIALRGKVYPSKSIATNEPQRVIDTLLGLGDQSIIYREDTERRLAVGGMAGQNTERLTLALEMAKNGQTLPKKLAQTLGIPEVLLFVPAAATPEEQMQLVKAYQKRLDEYIEQNGKELVGNISKEELRAVCHAYITVVEQNAHAAGTHRSLIQKSIINPQEIAEKEGRTTTVEQSRYGDEGLGGLPIPEVMRLQIVRKNDPLVYILKSVL